MNDDILAAVKAAADAHQIEPTLLRAFVQVESRGNPWVTRYEPLYHDFLNISGYGRLNGTSEITERIQQATSWGLMQVLGARARELGFRYLFPQLCQPQLGLSFGCLALKDVQERFSELIPPGALGFSEALACAYNAGHPRRSSDGKWIVQGYVDKVRMAYENLKA